MTCVAECESRVIGLWMRQCVSQSLLGSQVDQEIQRGRGPQETKEMCQK